MIMQVIHKTYYDKTFDGTQLFFQSWLPETQPVNVILLIHGFGEHSSRYHSWAEKFVHEGNAVMSFDHRGHGKSQGRRGDSKKYNFFLKDINVLFSYSNKLYPDVPKILYGHSFGGNVAANFLIDNLPEVKALVLSSPWIELAMKVNRIRGIAAAVLNFIWPSLIQPSGLKAKDISRDESLVEIYRKDELNHNKISVRVYFSIKKAGIKILNEAEKISVPTFIFQGTSDKITDINSSILLANKIGSHATFYPVENAFHETHHDPQSEIVFNKIINWINNL